MFARTGCKHKAPRDCIGPLQRTHRQLLCFVGTGQEVSAPWLRWHSCALGNNVAKSQRVFFMHPLRALGVLECRIPSGRMRFDGQGTHLLTLTSAATPGKAG